MGAQHARRKQVAGTRLRQIVLALLHESPTYTYRLYARVEERFGEVLPSLSASAIYQAIDALQAHGLVEEVPRAATDAPGERLPRVRYRPTTDGVAALTGWLAEEIAHDAVGLEVEQRLLAAVAHDFDVMERVVALIERAALEAADATMRQRPREGASTRDVAAAILAEKRRLELGARLEWAHDARARIRAARQAAASLGD